MGELKGGGGASLRLRHSEKAPPISIIALAALVGADMDYVADSKLTEADQPVLHLPTRDKLSSKVQILRYLARGYKDKAMAGLDVISSIQVDHWLDFSSLLVNGVGLEAACEKINSYLSLCAYLAGSKITAADVVCWANLAGALQWAGLSKTGKYPHLERWFSHMSEEPVLKDILEKYSPKRNNARKKAVAETIKATKADPKTASVRHTDASFDIGLGSEWKGRVVTRFPPEPSGFLHVGHAKALILNQEIASANNGKMLVRFDDTNPDKEKDEYMESILADCKTLGADIDRVTYTSDYFPQMLDLAERLIKAGHLYADDTPQEQMKEDRMAKRPSAKRDISTEESLRIWKEMKAGTAAGFKNCLRFRLDPASDNGTLRDPVAYRCNNTPHLRTGSTYKVYPTYDCACPYVDSLEKVTHALRSSEYKDREEQFYRILKLHQQVWPGLPDVKVWDYSRLSFVNTVLSKRKLTKLVDVGAVDGWDDPRMPTVQGLLRRGLTVPALREFMMAQGASRMVTYQDWEKLWTFNKKLIDPVCPRHAAVKSEGKVILRLLDVTETDYITVPKHKKNPDAGKKITMRSPEIFLDQEDAAVLEEGEEVTLMDWGNVIIQKIHKDASGSVSGLEGKTHLEGDFKKTKWKLTWLAQSEELIPLVLQDFDHLLTKKKLEDDDDILQLLTVCSKWEVESLGDSNMRLLQKGDILQLERKGYFIVDEPYIRAGKPMVLLSIPDGRTRTPVKPAEAVKAAEEVAAQRQAKIQADAREAAAVAEKAAAQPKENLKAANKKKKSAQEAVRKEDVSMDDTPVSTKVTAEIDPIAVTQNGSSTGVRPDDDKPSASSLQDVPPGSPLPTPTSSHKSSQSSAMPDPASSALRSVMASRSQGPSPTPDMDSATSPGPAQMHKLQQIVEEIVTDAGQQGGGGSGGSQPIPIKSPRAMSKDTLAEDKSVPATPTNTPQASFELPQKRRGQAEFSSTSRLFPTAQLAARGSVPPTPANTPQRSGELPLSMSYRIAESSPLSKQS